jgi:hypothetical protein
LYGHGQGGDDPNDSNYTAAKTLYGGAGNDNLYGGYGDDTLDGGTGTDTLTGGNGNDIFVIRAGDGSSLIEGTNIITDFSDGTDLIGLDNDLTFSELTIEQGTSGYINHTLVRITETGEYLLVIQNTTASDITELDFITVSELASSASANAADNSTDDDSDSPTTPSDDDDTPVTPTNDGPLPELPDLSLFVNDFALGSITLPETVVTMEDSTLPDLSDLEGLLGDQGESLELDFDAVDADTPVVASIGSVKPVVVDWTSQVDPFTESNWNPIIEELYYTAEFG